MKIYIGRYPKDSSKERKVRIEIAPYDVWNMDHTLSLIIVPMLKMLKEQKQGAPHVDDEDVPHAIKSTSAKPPAEKYELDEFWFQRWEYVMDEMIWAHEQMIDDKGDDVFYDWSGVDEDSPVMTQVRTLKVDSDGLEAYHDRIDNGLRLFGKYYRALWD